jgi:hypothetical protein
MNITLLEARHLNNFKFPVTINTNMMTMQTSVVGVASATSRKIQNDCAK